ncbi:MAG: sulfatase [Akkermansiaceae bacterium]
MSRFNPAKLLILVLALNGTSSMFAANGADEKPNVLFIAVDDLNDWVGYLGGHPQAQTPHIDALASEGVAFIHSYASAPVCGPSRTALMYGQFPHKSGSYGHHHVYSPESIFPQDRLPLNLVFQKNGYRTVGCGKIFHFTEPRGWDEYKGSSRGIVSEQRKKIGHLDYGILETENDFDTQDGKLTEWAIDQLQRNHEKPFFIALGLKKPHLPWEAPRKYFAPFKLDDVELPKVPENDLEDLSDAGKRFAKTLVGFRQVNDHEAITKVPRGWQQLVRAYLATVSFSDANVGRILEALEKSPQRDNTIVVLWGDHGWHLGEKNHWRKMALWERSTRTPFIIKAPGVKAKRVETPVSLQDIFPTLVDLCGLKLEQELDGNSLKSLLAGTATNWNKPVLMSHGPGNFAVRKNQWRLIRYADGGEELYDILNDPEEFKNLSALTEFEDTLVELRRHLPKTWRYVMGPRFKQDGDAFARPSGNQ